VYSLNFAAVLPDCCSVSVWVWAPDVAAGAPPDVARELALALAAVRELADSLVWDAVQALGEPPVSDVVPALDVASELVLVLAQDLA
jgi:hypothetical protein